MAIFHFSAKTVSRGKGQSAIAKAAYNAHAKIRDDQTGQMKDYVRPAGLMFSAIFAPRDAPAWAQDRAALWNAVEVAEKRKDAQLAREITIALPVELTDQQRKQLVSDFVREQFQRKGMVADVNIHAPGGNGDDRNHHAHILLTMRAIGPDGFGPKVREWNSREQLENWREAWERIQNRYLERYGHEARVDRRTLEAQGIERQPTTHLGPHAHAIEQRKRMETERGNIYRDTVTGKRETTRLKRELAHIERQIASAEHTARRIQLGKTRQKRKRDHPIAPHFQGAARAATQRQQDVRRSAAQLARIITNYHKASKAAAHAPKASGARGSGRIKGLFTIAAQPATDNHARHVAEPRRPGPMSRGELYEYYKRIGCLDVFFALFPGG